MNYFIEIRGSGYPDQRREPVMIQAFTSYTSHSVIYNGNLLIFAARCFFDLSKTTTACSAEFDSEIGFTSGFRFGKKSVSFINSQNSLQFFG